MTAPGAHSSHSKRQIASAANSAVKPSIATTGSTAGHEVRAFLACAGRAGVAAVLDAVQAAEPFDAAYARVGKNCVP